MRKPKPLIRGAVVYLINDTHPYLVVSHDLANKYADTIIVIRLSSRHKRMDLKTHAVVNYNDSIVLAEDIQTVRKSSVRTIVHVVNEISMKEVDKCLKAALDLEDLGEKNHV